MNLLIIGNGFDLAHGLPTMYTDFLKFCYKIKITQTWSGGKEEFEKEHITEDCPECIKDYVLSAFESRKKQYNKLATNENPLVQELYDNLEKNVWYKYLYKIYNKKKMRGINWIDFESEISYIIEKLDRKEQNLDVSLAEFDDKKTTWFIECFRDTWINETILQVNNIRTYREVLEKSYKDLRRFVRCMEIYFSDCVEKVDAKLRSNNILESKPDKVLSFNYTHTFKKLYPEFAKAEIHYIHGESRDSDSERKNNMVLGIDEYRDEVERDQFTNYNIYKKFTQRIINETGFQYREWFDEMQRTYENSKRVTIMGKGPEYGMHYIYVFGHSLDITDGDILSEMISYEGVITKIFYYDKQQQAQQIANLVKMIGQKKFIEMTNSVPQRIVFQQQADMTEIS